MVSTNTIDIIKYFEDKNVRVEKHGDDEYKSATYDQVYDYALDLRNFQKESHDKLLVPIMISTHARAEECNIVEK